MKKNKIVIIIFSILVVLLIGFLLLKLKTKNDQLIEKNNLIKEIVLNDIKKYYGDDNLYFEISEYDKVNKTYTIYSKDKNTKETKSTYIYNVDTVSITKMETVSFS